MKLKPYPDYKDSEVDWLGKVPNGWKSTPIKRFGKLKGGAGFPHEEQGVVSEEFDFHKVNALGSALSDGLLQSSENTISRETAQRLGAFIFPKRTIVFAKVGAALLLARIRELAKPACIDNNMMGLVVDQNKYDVTFIRYAMNLVKFDLISNPGAVPSINDSQIGNFALIAPNKSEQISVVTFLDRETCKLDTLISKQEHLIELLQEKRQAIISHAVTKGLNADAKMKDSGVEWLGTVPEGWEVKPLKHLTSVNDDVIPESTDPDDEIEYVDIGSVSVENGIEKTELMKFSDAPSRARRKVRDGDVIVSTVRTYLKAIAPINNPPSNLVCSTGFAVVRPGVKLNPVYAKYSMQTGYFIDEVIARSVGVSYPAINSSDMVCIRMTAPTIAEQLTIANFLNRETAKIDTLINKAKRSIELAKEHRTALISAAVTGKIDVREAA